MAWKRKTQAEGDFDVPMMTYFFFAIGIAAICWAIAYTRSGHGSHNFAGNSDNPMFRSDSANITCKLPTPDSGSCHDSTSHHQSQHHSSSHDASADCGSSHGGFDGG